MSDTEALREIARRLDDARSRPPWNEPLGTDSIGVVLGLLRDIEQAVSADAPAPDADADADAGAVQRLVRHLVPRWHFPMLNDDERNGAFEEAVVSLLQPDHTVLDIGAGSGVLALIAARAGARRVFTCELSQTIAEVARSVIEENGYAHAVEVIAKRSDEIDPAEMGGPADVIVSETFDCGLLGEALLATMRDARERLLAPGGVLVPSAASITAMLVESDSIVRLNRVGEARGFDVRRFNRFSTTSYFPVRIGTHPHRVLSERVKVVDLDFHHDDLLPSTTRHEFPVAADGVCHGVVFWFDVTLSPSASLENSPENPTSNWHQAVQLFTEPAPVRAGQTFGVTVAYDDCSISFSAAD